MAKQTVTTTPASLILLLDIQKKMAEARAEIPVIDDKLVTLQKNLNDFASRRVKLAELVTKREDIQADIYLGRAAESDLEPVDKEISEERVMLKAAALSLEEINSLMAGLKRRKDAIAVSLGLLETDRKKALDALIRETAEQVGAEYVRLAGETMEQIKRLFALSAVLSANGMPCDFALTNGMVNGAVFLPATNQVPSVYAASSPNNSGLLAVCVPVTSADLSRNLGEYAEVERQALLNAGVERLA